MEPEEYQEQHFELTYQSFDYAVEHAHPAWKGKRGAMSAPCNMRQNLQDNHVLHAVMLYEVPGFVKNLGSQSMGGNMEVSLFICPNNEDHKLGINLMVLK